MYLCFPPYVLHTLPNSVFIIRIRFGKKYRIILKWISERWDGGGVDWIDVAQDRDRWRALVYTVMNLRVP
jgi:hypothetical protein